MNKEQLVTVIIPTFNSDAFLSDCLKSIREQTYTNIEIIIVDNYSQDNTRYIAEEYGSKVVLCKSLRSAARNIGAKSSKGQYILSIDSDMKLTPNVIRECIIKSENRYDAIIIPEISIGEGYWAKCRALEKKCYLGNDLVEAARFFSRRIFEEYLEGYDPSLEAGEDWDIHIRIKKAGYRIGRIHEYIKHVEGKPHLYEMFNKKFRYGKTINRYFRKHQYLAKQQLGISRIICLAKCQLLTDYPSLVLGLFLIKTLEMVSYNLGRLTTLGERIENF